MSEMITSAARDEQWSHVQNAVSKPLLVIQAGPPKTGTTFIQNTLAKRTSRDVLAKDNYMYIGVSFALENFVFS